MILMNDAPSPPSVCSSGVGALDAVLGGGWPRGELNALSGPAGSGKTAIAMRTMVATLNSTPDSAALWVDALGVFDPARVHATAPEMLHRIHVHRTLDMHQLLHAVNQITDEVCVVVDHVSAPFHLALLAAGDTNEDEETRGGGVVMANALLVQVLQTLRRRVRDGVILLVNTVVPSTPCGAFASTTFHPALGRTFTHGTDMHVLLSPHKRTRTSHERVIVAEVLYARSTDRGGHWTAISI